MPKTIKCPSCKGSGKVPKPDKVKELEKEIMRLKQRIEKLEREKYIPPYIPPVLPNPTFPKPWRYGSPDPWRDRRIIWEVENSPRIVWENNTLEIVC